MQYILPRQVRVVNSVIRAERHQICFRSEFSSTLLSGARPHTEAIQAGIITYLPTYSLIFELITVATVQTLHRQVSLAICYCCYIFLHHSTLFDVVSSATGSSVDPSTVHTLESPTPRESIVPHSPPPLTYHKTLPGNTGRLSLLS